MGHVLVGIVDSVMVGALGKTPLAATTINNSIFALPLFFCIGISYGVTPLIAAADGEKNFVRAGTLFKHGVVINVLVAILLFLVFSILAPFIKLLGQPPDVARLAIPYFRIFIFSLIPLMIFQSFRQFAEGLSLTKHAMFISIGGNLFNIIANYVLIYGKLGFPTLGLYGAGWSTFTERCLMALVMGIFIFTSPKVRPYIKHLTLRGFYKATFGDILKIGVPSAAQFLFEVTAFSLAAIMMGWLGENELAAHQIALGMASLTYMVATGFSAGAVVRVGNFFGAKDQLQLRRAGFSAFILVGLFMGVCGAVFIIGNHFLPSLYISDTEVIKIASVLLVIAAFFQISDGIQVVGLGALRGMTDVKVPTTITFVAYWILGLPIAYYLGVELEMGGKGIWLGLLIGLSVSAVLLLLRFNFKSRNFRNK